MSYPAKWRAFTTTLNTFLIHLILCKVSLRQAGMPAPDWEPFRIISEDAGAFSLAVLPEGHLVVGTYASGVWIHDLERQRHRAILTVGQSGNALLPLLDGCLAAGGGGVHFLNTSSFQSSGPFLADVGVNAFLHASEAGFLVAGTDSGLYLISDNALRCTGLLDTATSENATHPQPPIASLLPNRFVYSLVRLPGGLLAAGTDMGVLLLDLVNLRPWTLPTAALPSRGAVNCLLTMADGSLLAGTDHGVLVFSEAALQPGGRPRAVLAQGSRIWALLYLPFGSILVGTDKREGALFFTEDDLASGGTSSSSLARGYIVWSLASLGDNRVAVGTNRGVLLFNLTSMIQ